jgi:hypothetical protein
MKKSISILVLLAIVATGAFAQGFSVGAGGLFDWSLVGNGLKMSGPGGSGSVSFPNLSFGGFVFLDATFAEVDASFAYGTLTAVSEVNGSNTT